MTQIECLRAKIRAQDKNIAWPPSHAIHVENGRLKFRKEHNTITVVGACVLWSCAGGGGGYNGGGGDGGISINSTSTQK